MIIRGVIASPPKGPATEDMSFVAYAVIIMQCDCTAFCHVDTRTMHTRDSTRVVLGAHVTRGVVWRGSTQPLDRAAAHARVPRAAERAGCVVDGPVSQKRC